MRAYPWCFTVLSLVLGCGAGTSSGATPRSTTEDPEAPRTSEPSGADGAEAPGGVAEESKPAGPSCDDGSCSRCGSGICPAGWYCDEKAPGGGACSWLAECAAKATCGCVTRVLGAACRCREEGGGIKVACD